MLWRWSTLLPLAERAGELVPVGRGGERRAIALANPGLPGTAVCDADAVGRDPVPRSARGGSLAPAHPDRVPLRGRGRGGVDQRRGRPGRDAAWGPAPDPGDALPRAPQHDRPPDGLDRRTGHPAGPHDRRGLLRVRTGRARDQGDPGGVAQRAALGPPGAHPGRRSRAEGVAADGLPLGAHRRRAHRPARAGGRGTRRRRRARPRRGPVHQPGHGGRLPVDHALRDAPAARGHPHRADPHGRFRGVAGVRGIRRSSPSATSGTRSARATCSVCRPGRASPSTSPVPASTPSGSPTNPSSRPSASPAPRERTVREARDHPHRHRNHRRPRRRGRRRRARCRGPRRVPRPAGLEGRRGGRRAAPGTTSRDSTTPRSSRARRRCSASG